MTIMFSTVLSLAAGGWGPPAGTALDTFFAYGALVLLVALVAWNARNTPDPIG